jgi:hypothetical protein
MAVVFALPTPARAANPSEGSAPSETAKPPAPPAPPASGVAVLARAGAEGPGWVLAKETYARSSLRPMALDEVRARILVGEAPPSGAPAAARDLADERAGIRGDDGAARALLHTIAAQLGVRAIIVVEAAPSGAPSARIFLAESSTFDAARYEPDPSDAVPGATPPPAATSDGGVAAPSAEPSALSSPPPAAIHWSGAVASLDRVYGTVEEAKNATPAGRAGVGAEGRAKMLATSPLPPAIPLVNESHPFYVSPWFWGAVGAAVFGGVAVYFATRDNTASTIHLEMQVPK